MSWTVNSFVGAPARAGGLALSLFVYDRSIDRVSAAAKIAKDAGVNVNAFREDVGVAWLNVIEPMWRQRPQAIAGITNAGALFCLNQLARSYRIACTFQLAVPSTGANALEAVAVRLLQAAMPTGAPLRDFEEAVGAPIAWLLQPIARNNQ
jgi:hypothetical protein